MSDQLHMIVALISEGRNFPRRSNFQLLFEAKFDGELLTTDGVEHIELPEITQELAWQISRKSLQQHRLHRTPIKIVCYALDTRTSAREQIGYIVLDVKSAPSKAVKKWHPLLNTKYRKSKPELRVAVYIEPVRTGGIPSSGISNKSLSVVIDESEVDLTTLRPELNDTDGVFQLGPPSRCHDIINISITVAFAGGLVNLVPSSRNVTIDPEGFYFFYTIFGNDVLTEKFLDLLDPKFNAERATIRMRTSVDILRHYLDNQVPIQFHLCTGSTSLGSAQVPLAHLLTDAGSLDSPIIHEGTFELHPPARFSPPDAAPTSGSKSVLGLVMQVYRDGGAGPGPTELQKASEAPPRNKLSSPTAKPTEPQRSNSPEATSQDYSDEFEDQSQGARANDKSDLDKDDVYERNSLTTTDEHSALSQQPHHYTFSLQLVNISNVHADSHIFVYFRYRYPHFGSASPILTHPAVKVVRDTEVILPSPGCSMDFYMSPVQLRQIVADVPFEIELWKYDQMAGNQCLGVAVLPLQKLLAFQPKKADKAHLNRQLKSQLDIKCNGRRIGLLRCSYSMVDNGEAQANIVVHSSPSPQATPRSPSKSKTVSSPVADPTQTAEYKAALQLEMWKETQEQLFEQQLKEKANKHLTLLSEEFKKRDEERELLCKKKVAENTTLQKELQRTMNQLSKKEKELSDRESQLTRLEADLKHSYERLVLDLQEGTKRMQIEKDHAISLARARTADCEETISRLKADLNAADLKYADLEKEFTAFKQSQHNKPEVKLHAEINLLTLEKVELERKLEACSTSRTHYKQQWAKALKENARLIDRANQQERDRYLKQNHELELIKQKIFAAEEREILKSERRELGDIREEIARRQKTNSPVKSTQTADEPKPKESALNKSQEEHLERLQLQRDELLRTGVYNTDDPIIIELEKQIRTLINEIDQSGTVEKVKFA